MKLTPDDLLDLRQLGYAAPLNAPGSEDRALTFLHEHREKERHGHPGAILAHPGRIVPVIRIPQEPPRKFPGIWFTVVVLVCSLPVAAVGMALGMVAGIMMGLCCCKEAAMEVYQRIRGLTQRGEPPPSAP